jgi:actin-related protein 10
MYPLVRTTPVAGIRFTEHLKQLILHFGSYKPPLATLGGSANLPSATQLTRVPEEILTDELVEEIKTECCFIKEPVEIPPAPVPAAPVIVSSDAMSVDETSVPPRSDAQSELSRPSSPVQSDHRRTTGTLSADSRQTYWEGIAAIYEKHSTTRDLSLKVNPPGIGAPTGRGTLIIPGWVRERAAEVLFEGGDVDESSVAEVILDCLMRVGHSILFGLQFRFVTGSQVPLDLRKTLISSILIVGGTAMLPGLIPRLRKELARALDRPTNGGLRRYDPYAPLKSLASSIAIVNDPAPPPSASSAAANAGKAPAFTPALFPWIGGSLAG